MCVLNGQTPKNLMQAIRLFADADLAERYVASMKWPDAEPICSKCGSINVGRIKSRRRYQCREKQCRAQFSVTTGTVMESTHLRLEQWLLAVWMIVNCKNGVSSCEIARNVGCKQQSAWHLLHRVRHIMRQERDMQFVGLVEADDTVIGGLAKFKHRRKNDLFDNYYKKNQKICVHAIRERKSGQVRAEVIKHRGDRKRHIHTHVALGSWLCTDSHASYQKMGERYVHSAVNHSEREYVRDFTHVNGCENFFNCLRRGLKGTYIRASKQHMQAYVDEQVYRFNTRTDSEWSRFDNVMRRIVAKRLTYSKLTGGKRR